MNFQPIYQPSQDYIMYFLACHFWYINAYTDNLRSYYLSSLSVQYQMAEVNCDLDSLNDRQEATLIS